MAYSVCQMFSTVLPYIVVLRISKHNRLTGGRHRHPSIGRNCEVLNNRSLDTARLRQLSRVGRTAILVKQVDFEFKLVLRVFRGWLARAIGCDNVGDGDRLGVAALQTAFPVRNRTCDEPRIWNLIRTD